MADLTRRKFVRGSAALAGMAVFHAARQAHAFPSRPGEEVLPWFDQPADNLVPQVVANMPKWEEFSVWITPNEKIFSVAHYNRPTVDEKTWKLQICSASIKVRARVNQDETAPLLP